MPTNPPYPVRISKKARAAVTKTAKEVGLAEAETVRQAIDLGLPEVKRLFGRKKKL